MIGALDTLLNGHVQAEALRAVRVAQGDRKAAMDNLLVMAAQDCLLQRALLELGIRKAVKDALPTYEEIVRTGGLYVATHPNNRSRLSGGLADPVR